MDELFNRKTESSVESRQQRPSSSRTAEKESTSRKNFKSSRNFDARLSFITGASCASTAQFASTAHLNTTKQDEKSVTGDRIMTRSATNITNNDDDIDDSILPNFHLTSMTTLNPMMNSTRVESIASISNLDGREGDHDESGRTLVI